MHFRLVVDGCFDGAVNMARDEAVFESALEPGARATLRLYGFASPTMTFGYGQSVADAVDAAECRRLGVDYVRRLTGGRALLHQHELTYSFATPTLTRSVRSTYALVTGALRRGLENLGIPLDSTAPRPPRRPSARLPCLAVPTGHEITSRGGDKLVASAMRFRRRGFLQHGSILWAVDRDLWRRLTHLDPGDRLPAVGIRELDGPDLPQSDLVDALSAAFSELLGAEPSRSPLTRAETVRARELEAKYRSAAWTERVSR